MAKETRWVIIGRCGLYIGQWLRRRDAIYYHCKDKGENWIECKKNGDKAIKATIIYKKQ